MYLYLLCSTEEVVDGAVGILETAVVSDHGEQPYPKSTHVIPTWFYRGMIRWCCWCSEDIRDR
jgi:hypothetical protein